MRKRSNEVSKRLAEAVRNSLNLPFLDVQVKPGSSRANRKFRLQEGGRASGWMELDGESLQVMRKIGLLPVIHLGLFRLAYDAIKNGPPPGDEVSPWP